MVWKRKHNHKTALDAHINLISHTKACFLSKKRLIYQLRSIAFENIFINNKIFPFFIAIHTKGSVLLVNIGSVLQFTIHNYETNGCVCVCVCVYVMRLLTSVDFKG